MAEARFQSAYLEPGTPCRWLRGNHHGHSTLSDGEETPEALIDAYAGAGYDYLALSEHDLYVEPAGYPDAPLCLLPAVEVTSAQGQTLMHLGAAAALPARQLSARQIMDAVHADGGLFVFDHPNWTPVTDYASDDLLRGLPGLRGVEIYCGVIERLTGVALATDRWDRLLSRGWRVWGHATDDQHVPADRFIAWNRVQWPVSAPIDAAGVIDALRGGRFTASTGVTIDRVGVDALGCFVESDADEIRWVGRGGVVLKKEAGGTGRLSPAELETTAAGTFVRAECFGRGAAMAWTQPFWWAAA